MRVLGRRSLRPLPLSLAVAVLATLPLAAADWPQWRGPNRDGRSPEQGLLQAWPPGGPALAWQTSGLGGGFSSVAVVGDRIYTLGDLGDGQYALALERAGGKLVWKTAIGPAWKDEFLGPRSTPTVDGDRVYVLSTEGSLCALAAASGEKQWCRDLRADFGATMMKAGGRTEWKFSESPLIDGDRVVVTPGAKGAALAALDKKTGKELWRASVPDLGPRGTDGAAYSSIVISNAGGIKHYVQLLGRGAVGIEAATGRFLWGYNRIANDVANIPTPIVERDDVFVSTGYGAGAALLRLEPADGGLRAREVYFLEAGTMQNHHGGMVLDRGTVYSGTGHNKGLPLAVSFETGKVAWGPERNAGTGSAAVSYADNRLYMRYQDGLVVLVEAQPETYRERGSFKIPGVEQPSWAHPVIAGGKLYLREQDRLYVYDVAQPPVKAEAR